MVCPFTACLVLPTDRESIVGGYWKDSVRIVLLYKKARNRKKRGNGTIKKKIEVDFAIKSVV